MTYTVGTYSPGKPGSRNGKQTKSVNIFVNKTIFKNIKEEEKHSDKSGTLTVCRVGNQHAGLSNGTVPNNHTFYWSSR